jgi:hypothetical protein
MGFFILDLDQAIPPLAATIESGEPSRRESPHVRL